MNKLAAIATIAALTLAGGCGGSDKQNAPSPSAPATFAISGVAQTDNVGIEAPGQPCEPGLLRDLRRGAQVTVTDASGKTIAVGELGDGLGVAEERPDGKTDWWCRFTFSVANVPSGGDFYGLQIAERPVKRFPASEIAKAGLTLTFLK